MTKLKENKSTFNLVLNCLDLFDVCELMIMLPYNLDTEKVKEEALKYMSVEGEEVSFILPSTEYVKMFYFFYGYALNSPAEVGAGFHYYKPVDYAAGERKGCNDGDSLEKLFGESKEEVKVEKKKTSKQKKYSKSDFAQLLADSF